MTRPHHTILRRPWAIMVALALLATACGGGSDDTSALDDEPRATEPPSAADRGGDDLDQDGAGPGASETEEELDASASSDDGSAETGAETTNTTAPPPTTTTEAPRPTVAGDRWERSLLLADGRGIGRLDFIEAGGALWLIGNRYNGTFALRSDDGGTSWSEVTIEAPPPSGASTIHDLIEGPNGRLVGWGLSASDCGSSEPAPIAGYRRQGACRSLTPTIHLSDDGESFRQVQPSALRAPAGSSQVISSITATSDGYVAVGTIRNEDWRGRVWTSPDAETWTLAAELRGTDGPLSLSEVVPSDDGIIVLGFEHPCSKAERNVGPGWYLGPQWADHARVYAGPSAGQLSLLDSSDPMIPARAAVDCQAQTGMDVNDLPYPSLGLLSHEGVPTLLDYTRDPEPEDGASSIAVRYSQLIDGEWTPPAGLVFMERDISTGVLSSSTEGSVALTPFTVSSGELRFATSRLTDRAQVAVVVSSSAAVRARSVPQLIASRVFDLAHVDDTLLAVGNLEERPFDIFAMAPDEAVELFLWRSTDAMDPETPCELVTGGSCPAADLTLHPDYPDFQGLNLADIDLAFANLGEADFTGADLTGARLWGVGNFREEPILDGATLVDAELQNTRIRSLDGADLTGAEAENLAVSSAVGANFTDANLERATIENATDAVLTGARLPFAELVYDTVPASSTFGPGQLQDAELTIVIPEGTTTVDVSLAGWDLTDVEFGASGPDVYDGTQRVRITDLTGATLSGTRFYAVDMAGVAGAPDLSDTTVWDNSICPDGSPPDDGPIGTCVRS